MEGTEKGFHKYIKDNFFDTFISYIESYKNDCINAYAIKSDFVPIIKRLLAQYKDALDNLYESKIRDEWSVYFFKTETSDILYNKTKQAYQFFYNASAVQIFFLGKLIEKMKENLAEFEIAIPKPEPEYFFSILPEYSKERHNILYDIHKNLKGSGYVDCSDEAFKKVFTTKEPKPIKWLKSQRTLTYFIKQLTGKFLKEKSRPSNFFIADRYFHIYNNGKYLHPKKLRHDKDPNLKEVELINSIIDNAIHSYR
jgi:hypothetical protein